MTYNDLDINQRINLKATLQAWAKYSVEHFQVNIDKKVYGILGNRTNKKGVQRTSLSKNYRFGAGVKRTKALRRAWYQNVNVGGGIDRVMLQFLLYGRFLDMGVGSGTRHTDRVVARQLKLGRVGRSRKPWYSKSKTHEVKRLREILAEQRIHIALDAVENAMNITTVLNL